MFRLSLCLAVLFFYATESQAQWFPIAPWNQARSDCYQNAAGQTICPTRAPLRQAAQAARYPSVSSASAVTYSASVVSYGSTGGAAATGYGSAGGAATSMGSTGGMSVVTSEVVSTSEASTLARRSDFRRALLDAARKAQLSGEIDERQYFKIVRVSLNPIKLREIEEATKAYAVESGEAQINAIDWDKLLAFLERIIPILIELFGANAPHNLNDMQYAQVAQRVDHALDSRLLCDWTGLAS